VVRLPMRELDVGSVRTQRRAMGDVTVGAHFFDVVNDAVYTKLVCRAAETDFQYLHLFTRASSGKLPIT
jgi:hypothetical protein